MADEATAQDGQTEQTTVDTEQQQQVTGTTGQTPELLAAELERTRKALKDANREAAERRKKLEAFEAAEKERQEKELSEAQKLQKQLEEERATRSSLESKLRANTIRSEVLAKAAQLDFKNPGDAMALLDLSGVEITDDGKVTGFEKELEALAKSGRLPMKNQQQAIGNQTRRPAAVPGNNNQQPAQDRQKPIVRF